MRYAVTGITGNVGGQLAHRLLDAGHSVRAVARDDKKAEPWAALGCTLALAAMDDAAALTAAFTDVDGVFVLPPPNFDPSPGFPEVRRIGEALRVALTATKPGRMVCISTIGARAAQENLLSSLGILEQMLGELATPIAFLRPAWFMDNCAWDIAPARETGVVPSFLQPLDQPFPMVATVDVARAAAQLLQESWTGRRIVELEGPTRVRPLDIVAALARLLGKPLRMEPVARDTWEAMFVAQGMKHPRPRTRMLDGFNEGWIAFEGEPLRGTTTLESVLDALIARPTTP